MPCVPVWLSRIFGVVALLLSRTCVCVCVLLVHAASSAAAVPMETQPLFALCVTVPNLDFHAFGSLVP